MEIINDVDFITVDEIKSCISLLHNDYRSLVNKIHVYSQRDSFFKQHEEDIIKSGEEDIKAFGVYDTDKNNVYVLSFNYDDDFDFYKFQTAAVIFHELRHAWQEKYRKYVCDKYRDSYIPSGQQGYLSQWAERDAFAFENRMYFKHFDKLYKILRCKN